MIINKYAPIIPYEGMGGISCILQWRNYVI